MRRRDGERHPWPPRASASATMGRYGEARPLSRRAFSGLWTSRACREVVSGCYDNEYISTLQESFRELSMS